MCRTLTILTLTLLCCLGAVAATPQKGDDPEPIGTFQPTLPPSCKLINEALGVQDGPDPMGALKRAIGAIVVGGVMDIDTPFGDDRLGVCQRNETKDTINPRSCCNKPTQPEVVACCWDFCDPYGQGTNPSCVQYCVEQCE